MGTESIIVLMAVALLFAYLIIDVIMTINKRSSPSPITFILLITGVLFLILVPYRGQELKAPELAQILLMIGLVTITAVYASSTQKIAGETKEERCSESLPLLVPDITRRSVIDKLDPNEVGYQTLQTGVGIEVIWHNLGKGVAINSRFSFWSATLDSTPGKALYFPPSESTFLEIEGRKEI